MIRTIQHFFGTYEDKRSREFFLFERLSYLEDKDCHVAILEPLNKDCDVLVLTLESFHQALKTGMLKKLHHHEVFYYEGSCRTCQSIHKHTEQEAYKDFVLVTTSYVLTTNTGMWDEYHQDFVKLEANVGQCPVCGRIYETTREYLSYED